MNEKRTIEVEGRTISEGSRAFIVAEAACNHLCDMKNAFRLIDEAAKAGADAIKFQTYKAERLTTRSAGAYGNIQIQSQLDYYKQFDKFDRNEYESLFEYAREKGIIGFSTPFDPDCAQMLISVQQPIFKIASCDLLYADLLREVACFNIPIILSTGASTRAEIENALEILDRAGARDVILLACTMAYPARHEDAHYRKILGLREAFPDYLIGVSDHVEPEEHMISGAICVSLGAKVLEKHFTLDRKMGGGSSLAMEPADLAKYVRNIRLAEILLGSSELKVHLAEEMNRVKARRSLVANFNLKAGTVLSKEMIGVKRPGTGILPDQVDKFVGKVLKIDLREDTPLDWFHIDGA